VFAGQFSSGQLLGQWRCVESVAAAAAASMVDTSSASSSGGVIAALPKAAGSCSEAAGAIGLQLSPAAAWDAIMAGFRGTAPAGAAAAGAGVVVDCSYDWLMHHDVPDYTATSSISGSTGVVAAGGVTSIAAVVGGSGAAGVPMQLSSGADRAVGTVGSSCACSPPTGCGTMVVPVQ
jgi:hypothetical protein